ncbi:MAG: PadR family transcriptional regulator [Vulcanimicrobiaceae bacterium]
MRGWSWSWDQGDWGSGDWSGWTESGWAGRGHGSRARRGFWKWLLLRLLQEGPRHGYDLMQFFRQRGWRRAGPGSVYPTLSMLEEAGFVTSTESEGKRTYEITDAGRAFLRGQDERYEVWFQQWLERSAETEEPADRLRGSIEKLMGAVGQAARSSASGTSEKIADVLDRARKEIYTLLANE